MKTPEECMELFWDTFRSISDVEFFKRIQTEVWNAAIDAAAEIPSRYIHDWNFTPADIEKSILKLKK